MGLPEYGSYGNGEAGKKARRIIEESYEPCAKCGAEAHYTLDFDVLGELEQLAVCTGDAFIVMAEVAEQLEKSGKVAVENTFGFNGLGRHEWWLGIAVTTDKVDQRAVKRAKQLGIEPISPNLWHNSHLGYNSEAELAEFWQKTLKGYQDDHPETDIVAVKMFPQDLPDRSLGRLTVNRDFVSYKVSLNSYTDNERQEKKDETEKDDPRDYIYIYRSPLDPDKPIIVRNPEDRDYLKYLVPLIKSPQLWYRFDRLVDKYYPHADNLNPEIMVHMEKGDPFRGEVDFMTDLIVDDKGPSAATQLSNSTLSIGRLLANLMDAPIIPFNYIATFKDLEKVFFTLMDASQGVPIHPSAIDIPSIASASITDINPAWSGEIINRLAAMTRNKELIPVRRSFSETDKDIAESHFFTMKTSQILSFKEITTALSELSALFDSQPTLRQVLFP